MATGGWSPIALTAVIAARVAELRAAGGLSGAKLAERMAPYGVSWNRTTVAKLESGRREQLTVGELVALALALGTTPLSLLADPRIGQPVPLGQGIAVDPWTVAQWAMGDGHNAERDHRLRVDHDTWTLFDLARAIADLCRRVLRPPAEGQDHDGRDRSLLRLLADSMDDAGKLGAGPYPVPDAVRARAAELGMPLPGEDG